MATKKKSVSKIKKSVAKPKRKATVRKSRKAARPVQKERKPLVDVSGITGRLMYGVRRPEDVDIEVLRHREREKRADDWVKGRPAPFFGWLTKKQIKYLRSG